MSLAWHIFAAGFALLVLFAMFRPLELAFPARGEQKLFRPHWFTDLCYLLGQYLVFNGAVFWALERVSPWVRAATPDRLHDWIAAQSVWVQLPLVVLIGDLLIYWGHRLQHRVDFLWRFHSIHHSAEHLDWLAAHREHPVDSLYTILLVNLPVFALGFPIKALAYFAAFRGLWAILIHANVRFPLPRIVRVLIGGPELHHWHHDRDRDFGNYANVSPLMDVIFGTYHCPDHEPAAFGVGEEMPTGYVGQLLHPFRRRRGATAATTAPSATRDELRPATPGTRAAESFG